jgi:hypothetical protein
MTQLLSWGNLAQPPDMFHQVSTSSQIRPGNTLAAWPPRRPLPRTQGLSRLSHACLITAFEANRVARVWDGSHCFFLLSPNAIGSGVIFSLGYYRCPARTGQNLRPLRDRDVLYVHHFLTPIQHSQALTSSLVCPMVCFARAKYKLITCTVIRHGLPERPRPLSPLPTYSIMSICCTA